MHSRQIGRGDYTLVAHDVPGYVPSETFIRAGFPNMPDAVDYARKRLAAGSFEVLRVSDGVVVHRQTKEG